MIHRIRRVETRGLCCAAYGKTKPRLPMRREDYLTGAQAQVDGSIRLRPPNFCSGKTRLLVNAYSPPTPEISPEIGPSNSESSQTTPSGAQEKTSIFASYRESIIGNPLVAGVAAFFGHVVK
jgi:hypothetical protein